MKNAKRIRRRLTLSRHIIRQLSRHDLDKVAGGTYTQAACNNSLNITCTCTVVC